MIAALDVQYTDTTAHSAAVVFENWQSNLATAVYTAELSPIAEYKPGSFFERELQPLLKVYFKIQEPIDFAVIDGYCHLSHDNSPGLGVHFLNALSAPKTIIGVAKNRYRDSTHASELLRGTSLRPLFVTSIGMDYTEAAKLVGSMTGPFRVPEMLKLVDQLARQRAKANTQP